MSSLDNFLKAWEKEYVDKVSQIPIFNTDLTANLSQSQKEMFVKLFYHLRGHFHDFLWYVGNHADDKETKDIVLSNIAEEFNGGAKSHEQLYMIFAESLGLNIRNFFQDKEYRIDFVEDFNNSHIDWLHKHSADHCFCAFAAYEKLDNVDYQKLMELVKSFGISHKGQVFFKIHSVVEHFQPTYNKLSHIWSKSEEAVKDSFTFITDNQAKMWQKLSDKIFNVK